MIFTGEMMPDVIPAERKKRIIDYISLNGSAQIKELSMQFAVSEATIRRDLTELQADGLIERTHGGAVLRKLSAPREEQFVPAGMGMMIDEKRTIARYAASLVQDGEIIYLDAGSTTFELAKELTKHINLSVVTCDLHIAGNVVFHPSTNVVVTGGNKRRGTSTLTGIITANFLRDIHADKCFLGANGVNFDYGVSSIDFYASSTKRIAAQASDVVYLLADHTKFGKTAFSKVCSLAEIDLIITDKALDNRFTRVMDEKSIAYFLA